VDEQNDEVLALLQIYRATIPISHISKQTITSDH